MRGKERRDDTAPPERAGGEAQPEEQQDGIEGVERRTDQQMRSGVSAEEHDIELVRKPRYRMPIRGVNAREVPTDAGRSQSAQNVGIVRDVEGIVVIDELMGADLRVNRRDEYHQGCADDGRTQKSAFGAAPLYG